MTNFYFPEYETFLKHFVCRSTNAYIIIIPSIREVIHIPVHNVLIVYNVLSIYVDNYLRGGISERSIDVELVLLVHPEDIGLGVSDVDHFLVVGLTR